MPNYQRLCEIYNASLSDFWTEEHMEKILNSAGTKLIVDVHGFLIYRAMEDEAEIITIAVEEKHRRKGLGRELLANMLETLKKSGVSQVFLEVAENNLPAICLYESCGFFRTGRRQKYYNNVKDAIIMSLPLES